MDSGATVASGTRCAYQGRIFVVHFSNNDEISRVVGDMVRALDVSINAKREDEILIYTRTSVCTKHSITSEEVVQIRQIIITPGWRQR